MIIQQLVNGLTLGTTYSLLALGFSLIFGVLSFINFAHGGVAVFGAYTAWYAMAHWAWSPIPAVVLAILVSMSLGVLLELIGYRPIRNSDRINAIIVSLGFSFILVTLTLIVFGTQSRPVTLFRNAKYYEFGNVVIGTTQIGVFAISIAIMIALTLLIKRTKLGLAIRAISLDRNTSGLMGVNVDKVISFTFALGSALGAISAVLMSGVYGALYPTMGEIIGTKGFAAVVLGGAGSIPGAMVGGILIGVFESLAGTFFNAQVKDAVAFIILIVMLILRPQGLLVKEKIRE